MKIQALLVTVIGVACIGQGFAQDKTVDAATIEKLKGIISAVDDAFLKGDAKALANFFSTDAVLVTPDGPIVGRDAIEKYHAEVFKHVKFISHVGTLATAVPIGTDAISENGSWAVTVSVDGAAPSDGKGYWTVLKVKDGDQLLMKSECYNVTQPPPSSSPTAK